MKNTKRQTALYYHRINVTGVGCSYGHRGSFRTCPQKDCAALHPKPKPRVINPMPLALRRRLKQPLGTFTEATWRQLQRDVRAFIHAQAK